MQAPEMNPPGAAIAGLAFMGTFAAGYGMWAAYAIAQAHGSLLKLLFSAFRRKSMDRE